MENEAEGPHVLTVRSKGHAPGRLEFEDLKALGGEFPPVALHRERPESIPLALSGRVLDAGRPREGVRVSAFFIPRREPPALNARVFRGLVVPFGRVEFGEVSTDAQGAFEIRRHRELPDRVWSQPVHLELEEACGRRTWLGPLSMDPEGPRQDLELDRPRGRIEGRVSGMPASAAGRCAVVAFNRTGLLEDRVLLADGRFAFDDLPEGDYALQVATGRRDRSRIPSRKDATDWMRPADPWRGLAIHRLPAGGRLELVVDFPA